MTFLWSLLVFTFTCIYIQCKTASEFHGLILIHFLQGDYTVRHTRCTFHRTHLVKNKGGISLLKLMPPSLPDRLGRPISINSRKTVKSVIRRSRIKLHPYKGNHFYLFGVGGGISGSIWVHETCWFGCLFPPPTLLLRW